MSSAQRSIMRAVTGFERGMSALISAGLDGVSLWRVVFLTIDSLMALM